jgi:hypothetical protein
MCGQQANFNEEEPTFWTANMRYEFEANGGVKEQIVPAQMMVRVDSTTIEPGKIGVTDVIVDWRCQYRMPVGVKTTATMDERIAAWFAAT